MNELAVNEIAMPAPVRRPAAWRHAALGGAPGPAVLLLAPLVVLGVIAAGCAVMTVAGLATLAADAGRRIRAF